MKRKVDFNKTWEKTYIEFLVKHCKPLTKLPKNYYVLSHAE